MHFNFRVDAPNSWFCFNAVFGHRRRTFLRQKGLPCDCQRFRVIANHKQKVTAVKGRLVRALLQSTKVGSLAD